MSVYVAANRVRTVAIETIDKIFESCDVIVTPSTASVAPLIPPEALESGLHDLMTTTKLIRFSNLANFVGTPALAVPIGYSDDGLPTSLQIMGKRWYASLFERKGFF
jgi:Asp-tRNA(Asn)/Glu-tRNA(Gln) amidotransferase A subunit family amidase